MIEREQFAKVMGAFADRIGRALTPFTSAVYFDTLSRELTTEEFTAGARIVFRTHQFNTWPAPQQFIDAVKPKPAPELEAAEVFEKVRAIVSHHGLANALLAKAEIQALGPVAERAYRAAGGFRDFVNVMESDLPFLRRRFVESYAAAVSEEARRADATAALDAGALDPRVHGLVKSTVKSLSATGRDRALPAGDRDVA